MFAQCNTWTNMNGHAISSMGSYSASEFQGRSLYLNQILKVVDS